MLKIGIDSKNQDRIYDVKYKDCHSTVARSSHTLTPHPARLARRNCLRVTEPGCTMLFYCAEYDVY
jgi:hypothetical protein